jgi:hypothetical protein
LLRSQARSPSRRRRTPATHIADIEKVETVFKGGVGYDPAKLAAAAKGVVGRR